MFEIKLFATRDIWLYGGVDYGDIGFGFVDLKSRFGYYHF